MFHVRLDFPVSTSSLRPSNSMICPGNGPTLDTKKGYKTKTGCTSSVTLTLNLTPPPPHP